MRVAELVGGVRGDVGIRRPVGSGLASVPIRPSGALAPYASHDRQDARQGRRVVRAATRHRRARPPMHCRRILDAAHRAAAQDAARVRPAGGRSAMILDFFGYDRHGEVTECRTTLEKNALGTRDEALGALGFNAPAWIAAVSMSVLYSVVGAAAPLAIAISFLFPMLVLALCLVYLTRAAPSAGGIFTFSSRFLHPAAGTILGWAYTIACAAVVPLTAIIGTQYLQALFPAAHGTLAANIIGTLLIVVFTFVCLRGVTLTARLTIILLSCELTVIVGLGMLGIVSPHVHVPTLSLFTPPASWSVL